MIKRTNSMEMDQHQVPNNNQKADNITSSINYTSNDLYNSDVLRNDVSVPPSHPNHTLIRVTESKIIHLEAGKNPERNQSMDSLYGTENQAQMVDQVHQLGNQQIHVRDINLTEEPRKKKDNIRDSAPSFQSMTGLTYSLNRSQNPKLPNAIRQSIVMLATGKKVSDSKKKTQLSKSLIKKYRQIKNNNKFTCQICLGEYDLKQKTKIGKCQHEFCDSCIRHYTDYKIARFEEVACPSEGCPETLDTAGQFFKTLSASLKEKYSKVHAFYVASQNSNARLCPNEKCAGGIIIVQQGISLKCNKCNNVYCSKCFFPQHQGPCQKNQVDFFQNNLHYRQCNNCKSVVQKNQGCNHITCRCKYQFCYLCGAAWKGGHVCQALDQPLIAQLPPAVVHEDGCCYCLAGCGGDGCVGTLLRGFLKIFIFFPLFIAFAVAIISLALLLIPMIFALTILLGVFPYTIVLICEADGFLPIILFLLYPFVMILGILTAFAQFFCELVSDVLEGTCDMLSGGFENLFGW